MIRRYELPYPPSVNHYWRHVGNRTILSREGRAYRRAIVWELTVNLIRFDNALYSVSEPMEGPLLVRIQAFPPDHRKRDLDNILKSFLDSLQHAGVYEDDSQIDRIELERGEVVKGGKVIVELEPFGSAMQAKATGRAPDRSRGHHRSPMAAGHTQKEQR